MLWAILIITILAVGWGWKNSRYLLPLLILGLPLEISRTWFPHLNILDKLGEFVGIIYFGRILTLAVIAYFIYSLLRSRRADQFLKNARDHLAETLHSPLFIALGSYIIWGAFSVIWSVDRIQTIVGVARLALLWLLGAAVYDLVKRRDGFVMVPAAFAAVSSFLAGIGVYELVSKHYIWLGEGYLQLNRINASFVDANIYARFLLIGCLATAMLMLNATRNGRLVGALALALQMAALLGTGSRMGWLAMIIIAIGLAALVPRRVVILPILGVLALSGVSILLNHQLLGRALELTQNFGAASTDRRYLIDSGVQMFTQHPVQGIGLAGFQHAMLTTYASIGQGISLSHTALITTAAELGSIGLGILVVFFVALYGRLPRARKDLRFASQQFLDTKRYYWEIFAVLAITAIFISAQGEGRFLEDPYLWILTGYLTAVRDLEEVS
jgi:O-antigen ligase